MPSAYIRYDITASVIFLPAGMAPYGTNIIYMTHIATYSTYMSTCTFRMEYKWSYVLSYMTIINMTLWAADTAKILIRLFNYSHLTINYYKCKRINETMYRFNVTARQMNLLAP